MKKKPNGEINWEALHRRYYQKLTRVIARYKDAAVNMKVKKFEMKRHFGAEVEPADARSEQLLDKMFADFSRAAGLSVSAKRYPYHVSLAYGFLPLMPHLKSTVDHFIQQLESEVLPLEFEILPPFFAIFEDMGEFAPYQPK
eukprot:CAMPEP_0116998630 /NCGR_PEP_ID=MMETSP0472-20121206/1635_1 /TAXON_ID=693140 ORGANISM="Tiarina fusus, Strain LIS" /NCGR_SAMPLE_ID=MMETSP0472 /ASSEMBLY_ACC=CAM_ASM_000603 /LENGTH=141 /DNA_ID=CAMNT_0004697841 /DNA_START=599 /DNA_END=1027 /DNA_ORIENTATION=-